MQKSVVITGVSSGIGWAATKACLDRGLRVFGTVRHSSQAAALRSTFGTHFHPLLLDVTDVAAIEQAAAEVAEVLDGQRLAGLVNNAGIAVAGPLLCLPMSEIRQQMEVNLLAPLQMIQTFAPLLGADPARHGAPGRILNISSVSGKIGYPFVGAYAASKHALEGASESLRRELMLYGIDVILYAPGAIQTPIWDKSDLTRFAASDYGPSLNRMEESMRTTLRLGLDPAAIGRQLADILLCARPKARYSPTPNRLFTWILPRLLPSRWLDRIIARHLGLSKSV